jgi:sugar/nucleoside kinase (ribokinase family)
VTLVHAASLYYYADVDAITVVDTARFDYAASAISVTRPGAHPSAPGQAEIYLFLNRREKR